MNKDSIYFGLDYYPEHWPRERWDKDAKLMKEAGFDAVRLGEFAWAKLESSPGCFHFGWLDEVISLFGEYGIKAVLGTPSAAPPAWMVENCPEILPVNNTGVRLGFGGRHHTCHSSAVYRDHVSRIVTAIADHYCENGNISGWQIDNELGNSHEGLCLCDNCRRNFQKWLEKKYQTIENLNGCWGTVFWSQAYSGFHEIPAPRLTPNSHNPSLLLDWKRFCSDLIVEFQQLQIDIIRSKCKGQFITGNFMGFFNKTDYFDLSRNLDFVSHDQYPGGFWLEAGTETPPAELAANLDLIRGMKDTPFWVIEQQAGPTGWETIGKTPRPGQLKLWTAQSVARGADAVFFFRWRTSAFGTEQFWHGILPHNGVPGRRYDEIKETISQLRPVMEKIKGIKSKPDVALLFSYDQNWALEIQSHHPDLDYTGQVLKYHAFFYDKNIPVDFIFPEPAASPDHLLSGQRGYPPESGFPKYRLIVLPLQFLILPGIAGKIKEYVSEGGNAVFTMRSGVKNENNACVDDSPLPCAFGDLLGIEINDYDCLRGGPVKVNAGGKNIGDALKWCDIIELKNAEALAFYGGEYYKDTPAVTENIFGKGRAFYIGFEPDKSSMNFIMEMIIKKIQIDPIIAAPEGAAGQGHLQVARRVSPPGNIEIIFRPSKDCNFYFVLNHSESTVDFSPKPGWKAILGAEAIKPYGLAIYCEDGAAR